MAQEGAHPQVLEGKMAKLEAQEAPKSRPEPQKIDVKKQHVFDIHFFIVRTSFWKGFW